MKAGINRLLLVGNIKKNLSEIFFLINPCLPHMGLETQALFVVKFYVPKRKESESVAILVES